MLRLISLSKQLSAAVLAGYAHSVHHVQELHRTYGLGVLHAARKDPTCSEGARCGWGRQNLPD